MRGKLKKAYGAEFDVYFMLAVQLVSCCVGASFLFLCLYFVCADFATWYTIDNNWDMGASKMATAVLSLVHCHAHFL